MGEVARALIAAAATPGTVRQLAERTHVGYAAARFTASRLVMRGILVAVDPEARPAQLIAAKVEADADASCALVGVLNAWGR